MIEYVSNWHWWLKEQTEDASLWVGEVTTGIWNLPVLVMPEASKYRTVRNYNLPGQKSPPKVPLDGLLCCGFLAFLRASRHIDNRHVC